MTEKSAKPSKTRTTGLAAPTRHQRIRKEVRDAQAARLEPARRLVEQREIAFVSAWLKTRSTAKAWKIAYDPRDNQQMSEEQLAQRGNEILALPSVARRIDEKLAAAAKTLEVDAQRLVLEWWEVATASPADMVQVRVHNCRYCYGADHNYQWTGEAEYLRACEHVREANEGRRTKRPMPSNAGGYGFQFSRTPHASCPQCSGGGDPVLWIKDSRDYSDQERLLFDGVKQTKDGIEVKFRDRDAAMQNIARVLGLMAPTTPKDNDPIATFDKRGDNALTALPSDSQSLSRLYHDFIGEE